MATTIAKNITDILIKEWKKKNISIVKMSERTGMSKDALWKIRHGQRNAGLDSACAMAKALDVRIGVMIDGLISDLHIQRRANEQKIIN